MGHTKIIVVQLKELLKTALFALLGILLIALLIYFFLPREKNTTAMYTPGTYSSQITLHNTPVSVDVTVTSKKITSIQLKNMAEVQEVFYPLVQPTFDKLAKEIVKSQSLDVNIPQDAVITSNVLLDAVSKALLQAHK